MITTTNALAARDKTNAERIERLWSMVSGTDTTEEDVYDGTPPCREDLVTSILQFACADNRAEYVRADGWQRIPVDDFAAMFGVKRKTIYRALVSAEEQGLIERKHKTIPHDGGHRRDSDFRVISEP